MMNEFSTKEIQEQTAEYISRKQWDYFITLNFNRSIREDEAQRILRKFLYKLNDATFGRRSKKSIVRLPIIESNNYEGLHIHLLLQDPKDRITNKKPHDRFDFKRIVKQTWEATDRLTAPIGRSCPGEENWFKTVYENDKLAGYVTKQIRRNKTDIVQWDLVCIDGNIH